MRIFKIEVSHTFATAIAFTRITIKMKFHSASGRNQGDGVQGALIVREPNDPNRHLYDYDFPSHIIFVHDWNHYPADIYWPGYYQNISHTIIKADSYLINGRGTYSV